jgi:uncharacterized protein (TIGR03382 family)
MRDGSVAMLFGTGRIGHFVMYTPDNTIVRKRAGSITECSQFVATANGFAALCDRDNVALFDTNGEFLDYNGGPTYSFLASAQGGALFAHNDDVDSLITAPLDRVVGDRNVVFAGRREEVGGCNAGGSSSGLLVVGVFIAAWRTKRSSSKKTSARGTVTSKSGRNPEPTSSTRAA